MDNNKIEQKIDKLDERLDSIDKTLVVNTKSLEDHIKRTTALEDYVKEELTPIKSHVNTMKLGFMGIAWFCGIIASVAGFIYIIKQLISP